MNPSSHYHQTVDLVYLVGEKLSDTHHIELIQVPHTVTLLLYLEDTKVFVLLEKGHYVCDLIQQIKQVRLNVN